MFKSRQVHIIGNAQGASRSPKPAFAGFESLVACSWSCWASGKPSRLESGLVREIGHGRSTRPGSSVER